MEAKLLKPTTDAELQKYHSREEVLVARGMGEVVEWIERKALKRKRGGYRQAVSTDRIITEQAWQAKLKEWGIDG